MKDSVCNREELFASINADLKAGKCNEKQAIEQAAEYSEKVLGILVCDDILGDVWGDVTRYNGNMPTKARFADGSNLAIHSSMIRAIR